MDYQVPPVLLPSNNPLLSPPLQALDRWIRFTISSAVGFTLLAPAMRGITMRISEYEHRRQKRFIPPIGGPFNLYGSVTNSIRAVWHVEGWKGFYRGMSALYATLPIRSAYFMILYNYIEFAVFDSSGSWFYLQDPYGNKPKRLVSTTEVDAFVHKYQSRALPTPPSTLSPPNEPLSTEDCVVVRPQSRKDYLMGVAGIIALGEFILYPARYVYTIMAGDLLGEDRIIRSKRIRFTLSHTVRKNGVLGVYHGFLPCLIAITIPALFYASHRFTHSIYEAALNSARKEDASANTSSDANPFYPAAVDTSVIAPNPTEERHYVNYTNQEEVSQGRTSLMALAASVSVYPLIATHIRIVTSHLQRAPNPNKLLNWPAKEYPKFRSILANLFPSTSTASSDALYPTLRRTSLVGMEVGMASFCTALVARAILPVIVLTTASILSWPLLLFQNNSYNGVWSIADPIDLERSIKLQTEIATIQQEKAAIVAEQMLNPPSTLEEMLNSTLDVNHVRYSADDQALLALGLKPTSKQKKKDTSFSSTDAKMTTEPTATKPPSEALKALQSLDLEEGLAHKPSERASKPSPTTTGTTTTTTSDYDEAKKSVTTTSSGTPAASKKVPPKPVPIFSQQPAWWNDHQKL